MLEELKNKVVFISGASGMIGKALTEYLVAHNVKVVANSRKPIEKG